MNATKLLPASEAVGRFLPEGCGLLAVGGMHLHNNPMALVRETLRQRRRIRRLLTSPCGAMNADLLLGAGLVSEILTSYVGFEHLGLAPCFRRAAQDATVRILEADEAYLTHGLYAGAGGLPFVPLPAGLEHADVAGVNPESYRTVADPFTSATVLAGAPLAPDVAFIHAREADEKGNAVIGGAHFLDRLMALASKTVVVQAERVVPTARIASQAVGTTIPGFLVHAVVVAPGGCHPTASHAEYDFDEDHLKSYLRAARDQAGFDAWIDEQVRARTEPEYAAATAERLERLRYPRPAPGGAAGPGDQGGEGR